MLERSVDGNLLFQNLSLPAKLAIFNSMTPLQVNRGTLIIKQVYISAYPTPLFLTKRFSQELYGRLNDEFTRLRAIISYSMRALLVPTASLRTGPLFS
jgi:hypothetical protein